MVLVMSVAPGFGAQEFEPVALDEAAARCGEQYGDRLVLEVDGGVNAETIADCTAAGAQMLVVGSAIFRRTDRSYAESLAELNQLSRRRLRGCGSEGQVSPFHSMLNIVLIRSGRTEYDCQGRIQGTLDVPLSEDGRSEVLAGAAELAAQQASIAAIYAGPCRSAQETAEILGERLKLKAKTVESLHNLNQGLWQGMLFDEVKSKQPKVYRQWQEKPETVCPPEGETLQEARDRLKKALAKLAKKHKTGTIALVLGQPLASVLRSMVQQGPAPSICTAECSKSPLWEPLAVPEPLCEWRRLKSDARHASPPGGRGPLVYLSSMAMSETEAPGDQENRPDGGADKRPKGEKGKRADKRGVPSGLWIGCDECGAMIYRKDSEALFNVCPECDFHMYLGARGGLPRCSTRARSTSGTPN